MNIPSDNDSLQNQWQWAHEGPQKGFAEAYSNYRSALYNAWGSDAERRITESYTVYGQILGRAWESEELQHQVGESYQRYMDTLQQCTSTDTAHQQVLNAYHTYIMHIKEIWAEMDVENIDPASLAAIGQSMTWIAGVAIACSVHNK